MTDFDAQAAGPKPLPADESGPFTSDAHAASVDTFLEACLGALSHSEQSLSEQSLSEQSLSERSLAEQSSSEGSSSEESASARASEWSESPESLESSESLEAVLLEIQRGRDASAPEAQDEIESAPWMTALLENDEARALDAVALAAERDSAEAAQPLSARLTQVLIEAGSRTVTLGHLQSDSLGDLQSDSLSDLQSDSLSDIQRDARKGGVGAAGPSLRVLRGNAPRPGMRLFGSRMLGGAVAASLLIGFAVAIIALSGVLRDEVDGGSAEAEAGFYVESVGHYVLNDSLLQDGSRSTRTPQAVETARASKLAVGEVLAAKPGQMAAYGLGSRTHVLLGEGDTLRVASGEGVHEGLLERATEDLVHAATRVDGSGSTGEGFDLGTLLRLETGEALIDARADRPVLMLVGEVGLLVLHHGAAHVAHASSDDAAEPALALRHGAYARFHRLDAAGAVTSVELKGPTQVRLTAEGTSEGASPSGASLPGTSPSGELTTEDAASLFRDLAVFGGALRRQDRSRVEGVPARLWHRVDGPALRRDSRFRVALGGEHPGRVAFEPPMSLRAARSLLITLHAPVGTRVSLRALPESEDPARALVVDGVLDRDTRTDEPGLVSVTLDLPRDWASLIASGELVLGISGPESLVGQTAVLKDVGFLMPTHRVRSVPSNTSVESAR